MAANTGDPFWHDVILLLHFNGTNGSTTIVDSSKRAYAFLSARNGMALSTAQQKFGTSSGYFDGVNDILEFNGASGNLDSAFNLGTGSYCIEMWIYCLAAPSVSGRLTYAYDPYHFPKFSVGDNLKLTMSDSASRETSSTISLNEWVHVALDRSGSANKMFINGVQGASWTDSRNWQMGTSKFYIGAGDNGAVIHPFSGYIDEVRITKRSRYQANFTPPDTFFPDFPFQAIPRKELAVRQPLRVNQNITINRMGI